MEEKSKLKLPEKDETRIEEDSKEILREIQTREEYSSWTKSDLVVADNNGYFTLVFGPHLRKRGC
jgi:hypothetical protein